jgi:hypothetical protein
MTEAPIATWDELCAFAKGLGLPKVEESMSWGNPGLKAHGKLWCWWSPYVDAAVFKGSIDEREMLHAADPETFLLHDHYAKHGLILVAGGRIDRDGQRRVCAGRGGRAPKRWLARPMAGRRAMSRGHARRDPGATGADGAGRLQQADEHAQPVHRRWANWPGLERYPRPAGALSRRAARP